MGRLLLKDLEWPLLPLSLRMMDLELDRRLWAEDEESGALPADKVLESLAEVDTDSLEGLAAVLL